MGKRRAQVPNGGVRQSAAVSCCPQECIGAQGCPNGAAVWCTLGANHIVSIPVADNALGEELCGPAARRRRQFRGFLPDAGRVGPGSQVSDGIFELCRQPGLTQVGCSDMTPEPVSFLSPGCMWFMFFRASWHLGRATEGQGVQNIPEMGLGPGAGAGAIRTMAGSPLP